MSNLVVLDQMVRRYEGTDIRWKNWAARVPPFKVTHGHRNWHGPIGYLRLPITVVKF